MPREIKFRAWDEDGFMFYPTSIEFINGGIRLRDKENFGDLGSAIIALMQYTGLKDKNGVEIYEGDIVKAPDIFSDNKNISYSVQWNESYARFMTWHEAVGCCHFLYAFEGNLLPIGIDKVESELDARSIEVIGNIYENKELLEVKDA